MSDNIFDFVGEVLQNVPVGFFFFIALLLIFLLLVLSKNMIIKAWNRMSFGYKLMVILSFIIQI